MRYISRISAFLVLALLLALPCLGAQDAKKSDAPKDKDKDKSSEQWVKAAVVTGKIQAVVEDKKSIRLQVTYRVGVPNPGGQQAVANAQLALLRARNPQQLLQAQQQMARARQGLIQYKDVTKDYELQALDDVKVRMLNPPAQFDDKGKPKKYTRKELKELKGDDKLDGYPAEFADLKQGQTVQVTLVRKKGAPRTPVKRGKDADAAALAENPPFSMVIIVAEPRN